MKPLVRAHGDETTPRLQQTLLAGISQFERTYVPLDSTSYASVFDLLTGSITDFWIPCFYDPIPEPAECCTR